MVLLKIGGVQKKNGALARGTTKFHFGLLAEQSLLSPQASSPSLEPKKIKIHPRSLGVVGWWGNSKGPAILYGAIRAGFASACCEQFFREASFSGRLPLVAALFHRLRSLTQSPSTTEHGHDF